MCCEHNGARQWVGSLGLTALVLVLVEDVAEHSRICLMRVMSGTPICLACVLFFFIFSVVGGWPSCHLRLQERGPGQQAAKSFGGEFEQLDISSPASIDDIVRTFTSKHGGLDVLVNNAGISSKGNDPTPQAEQAEVTSASNFLWHSEF